MGAWETDGLPARAAKQIIRSKLLSSSTVTTPPLTLLVRPQVSVTKPPVMVEDRIVTFELNCAPKIDDSLSTVPLDDGGDQDVYRDGT